MSRRSMAREFQRIQELPKLYAKGREKSRLWLEIEEERAEYVESIYSGEGNDEFRDHNLVRQDGPGRN